MKNSMKTLGISAVLCAALAAPLASAQQVSGVARLKDVKGNVLVSQQSGLVSGTDTTRLAEHTRVITTAGSEATVLYDNGCEVRLKENQRHEIVVDKACAALIAESLFTQPPATAGVAIGALLIPVGGVGIASNIVQGNTPTTPLSPN